MSAEKIDVVVLAAGSSVRFDATGEECPKQFRTFGDGRMMMEQALDSLTLPARVHFAIRPDHLRWFKTLSERRQAAELMFAHESRGQAETLLRAVIQLFNRANAGDDLLVVNCDQGFAPGVLDRLVRYGRESWTNTALVTDATPEEATRWSYVDNFPWFGNAREKEFVEGGHGLAGAYYFKDRWALRGALSTLVHNQQHGEPYVSQVYGYLPGTKYAVLIPRAQWYDWGTPDALRAYEARR